MPPNKPAALPLRAIIVDDEGPGRVNLRYMLAAHPAWQLAGECASAAEARTALATNPVDVVFLDIQMPKESGLELARSLCTQAEPPLIIFITAYSAYALEAFEVHALDYLLKPIGRQRLGQALERARQMLEMRQRAPYGQAMRAYLDAQQQRATGAPPQFLQQITVRSVGKIEWIRLDDVFWMGSASNYVELHMENRTVLHRQPLGKLEEHLDPTRFLRVHRSAIVRADQISSLAVVGDGSYLLTLRCGDAVPVSERHVQQVRAHCR
jgi:two-component system, LytTR family, response regulator